MIWQNNGADSSIESSTLKIVLKDHRKNVFDIPTVQKTDQFILFNNYTAWDHESLGSLGDSSYRQVSDTYLSELWERGAHAYRVS